jgi:TonB family protein
MFVWGAQTLSTWLTRGFLYVLLFALVVVGHGALTNALREMHWSPGAALALAGALVLCFVIFALNFVEFVIAFRAARRVIRAEEIGLPTGPCCVVWRPGEGEADMPWKVEGPLRAPYPPLARKLGVEGFALIDFEIGADGAAKNIHCVDVWPNEMFYEASLRALTEARFAPKPGVPPRFGATYRMPFVFRIDGAASLADRGRRALPRRPVLRAAQIAVELAVDNLRRRA